MRKLLPYAATALLSVAAYVTYAWGGPVHALGLRHLPGCEACDVSTARSVLGLVQQAQAAPVGSAK